MQTVKVSQIMEFCCCWFFAGGCSTISTSRSSISSRVHWKTQGVGSGPGVRVIGSHFIVCYTVALNYMYLGIVHMILSYIYSLNGCRYFSGQPSCSCISPKRSSTSWDGAGFKQQRKGFNLWIFMFWVFQPIFHKSYLCAQSRFFEKLFNNKLYVCEVTVFIVVGIVTLIK